MGHAPYVGIIFMGCYTDGGLWYALGIETKHPIIISPPFFVLPNFYACYFLIEKRHVCIRSIELDYLKVLMQTSHLAAHRVYYIFGNALEQLQD